MNINDQVAVKLTDEGERMLTNALKGTGLNAEHVDLLFPYLPDGKRVFQLYELMRYFGPAMFMGNPALPIETEIEIL